MSCSAFESQRGARPSGVASGGLSAERKRCGTGRRAVRGVKHRTVIVDCAHYRDGERQHEGKLPLDVAEKCVVGDGDFVWLGLLDPTEEELRDVGERFGLHELAFEDAFSGHQRPKLEDYDDSYFIVLQAGALRRREGGGRVRRDHALRLADAT